MKQIFDSLKKQSPSRIIALGFSAVILVGAVLLMMPFSLKKGVHLSFECVIYINECCLRYWTCCR